MLGVGVMGTAVTTRSSMRVFALELVAPERV